MNQNPSNNANSSVSWINKAQYVGMGIVIGVVIAPLFKKVLGKIQPQIDKLFESMMGKTESCAEQAADLLAKAKEQVRQGHKQGKAAKGGSLEHDHGTH